ncbi:MAG: OmpA family protein [Proteobacteria bacterium]|nr:OmpA family protein [Pseudomonadota bacterium]
MKKQNFASLATIFFALVLTGCAASKGAYSGNIEDDRSGEAGLAPVSAGTAGKASSPGFVKSSTIDDERTSTDSLLQKRIIYFDYDKSAVRDEALPILHTHAEFLNNKGGAIGIVLGGHADNRGSNEYNLALGQRRANAVRDIFLSYGASANDIEAISFGEEQPRAQGDNESAWQENRRVEIRYTDE